MTASAAPTLPARTLARDFDRLPAAARSRGLALTIGNFDGVHRGHQAMLEVVCQAARQRGLTPAVLSFAPSPAEFFAAQRGVAPSVTRLQRLRDKLACIWAVGIEHIQLARFDQALAGLSPEAFCEQVLRQALNVRWLIVGEDFRYGHQRAGDVKTLHAWAQANGVECYLMPPVKAMEVRFSSSLVRQALAEGDLTSAAALLGRPYRISGKVAHGRKLGRSIGFPTLNLPLWTPLPLRGVYAVRVYGVDVSGMAPVMGAASVGARPTVLEQGAPLLEVHLLDFRGELYGRRIVVEFVQKLRDEEKFDSLPALTAQIERDVAQVRAVFAQGGAVR